MGDLLSKDMLGDVIINIVNIIVLYLVTRKILYKPVKKFLDARNKKVADTMTEAESVKTEALQSKEEYDRLCKDADKEKNDIISASRMQAQTESDDIICDARKQAEEIKEKALSEAQSIKAKAIKNAENDIADVSVSIAEKILAREVSDKDNKKLVSDFLNS